MGGDNLVLSAEKALYFGNVSGGSWNQTGFLDLSSLGSNTTDVANGWGLADLFVPTEANGIYAIRGGALAEQVDDDNVNSYDIFLFDPTQYDPTQMAQLDGDLYNTLNGSGVPLGGSNFASINLGNATTLQGMAQTADRMVGVMNPGFQEWNNQQYADGIVPEPGSMAIMAIGGMYLLMIKRRE